MEKIQLKDVLDVKRGASLSGEYYSTSGELIRLTLGNFNYPDCGWKENKSKEDIYFTGQVRKEFILQEGDIITPLTEQVRGLLGNTATIPESNKYIQSGDIGLIIPNEEKIDKRYSYYLISSTVVKKQLDAGSQQTKIRHTSPDSIKNCYAYILEREEQVKVACLLDSINKKIEINNSINDNLQQLSSIMYSYWFKQFQFPNENGLPYKTYGGKMKYSPELKIDIPFTWEIKTLKDLLIENSESVTIKPNIDTIDLSVMPSDSFSLNQINNSNSFTSNLFKMKEGDLLFGSIRPYLHKAGIAPVNGYVAGTVHSYKVKNDYDYNLALLILTSKDLFNYAVKVSGGTKMPVVSSDNLLNFKFAYSSKIAKLLSEIDIKSIIINNVQENIKLQKIRNYLLPLLMNAQISLK